MKGSEIKINLHCENCFKQFLEPHEVAGKHKFGNQITCVLVPVQCLTCCETLDKSLTVSKLQLTHLYSEEAVAFSPKIP